jgi:hypothetical protein
MTRKEYIRLARAFRETEEKLDSGFFRTQAEVLYYLRSYVTEVLASDNPHFDSYAFIAAEKAEEV